MSAAPKSDKIRFIGSERCPICGGADDDPRGNGSRCHGWRKPGWAYCSREDRGGGADYSPEWRTYAHRLQGPCKCGVEHSPSEHRQRAPRGKFDRAYVYRDAGGSPLFRVVRTRDPKGFYQQRWQPDANEFRGGLKGMKPVLYHLPELLAADPAATVYVVEGEKDVENLEALGLVATSNPMGAEKWLNHYSDALRGRRCVLVQDNDDAGRKHVQKVARSLQGKAAEVRILELPGLAEHGDVSDWLAAGGTVDRLRELAEAAPRWERPQGQAPSTIPGPWVDVAAEDDPVVIASRHLEQYQHPDGCTLRYHRGEFLEWSTGAWRSKPPEELRPELAATNHLHYMALNATALAEKQKRKISTKSVANVSMALESLTLLKGVEAPCWIGDGPFPASEVLPARNALVHLPSLLQGDPAIVDPTPRFFCRYALNYDFIPDAGRPVEWLKFLDALWGEDRESIDALQELFGYCLTDDTSQQKIHTFIGPKRSGKGTIARVLTALIGAENVGGPTLSGLSTNFGLAPLIGKPLAIVADARLSGRADQAVIVERLLSISGEDSLTIDRKHKTAWTGKLPTRFVLISNELPRLNDPSGALVGRMILLKFTRTFYNREDRKLFRKLLPELPGILLWAIEGWNRLHERGHFMQPASGQSLIDQMNDLSSPVGAFLRERCDIGPHDEVPCGDLFDAWRKWCGENGRDHTGNVQSFTRDLTAALPDVHTQATRRGGVQVRLYKGVALKSIF